MPSLTRNLNEDPCKLGAVPLAMLICVFPRPHVTNRSKMLKIISVAAAPIRALHNHIVVQIDCVFKNSNALAARTFKLKVIFHAFTPFNFNIFMGNVVSSIFNRLSEQLERDTSRLLNLLKSGT